jgi:hypothetical protein
LTGFFYAFYTLHLFLATPSPLCYYFAVEQKITLKILKNLTLGLILTLLFLPYAKGETEILPFEDIKAGMKGVGKTVFSGSKVEEFGVEILGKTKNVGPKQNIIYAKLSGGPLEKTGILSGMSGSPIYIDGKLAGAAAFMFSFSKEPIVGITPIGQMVAIKEKETQKASAHFPYWLEAAERQFYTLFDPEKLTDIFRKGFASSAEVFNKFQPIGYPIVASGFSQDSLPMLKKIFSGDLFTPIQTGGASAEEQESISIEPGSAVAAQLIQGDIDLSLVGTVTDVQGKRILAFGHPILNLGPIDIPMAASRVETLVPSLASSFKIAGPLNGIGSFTQDRSSGVMGYLDLEPNTIPVRIELFSSEESSESYSFNIIEDKLLTPLLLYHSLNGILSSAEKQYGDVTIQIKEGSTIKLSEGKSINLRNLYSGDYSRTISMATIAFITFFIMDNEFTESRIRGVNLLIDFSEGKKLARIEKVWCDRSRVKPGDQIDLRVTLKPYRGETFTKTKEINIPEELPPGKLTLHVGDAYVLSRRETREDTLIFRDFDHMIQLINNLRMNDRIYLLFTREDRGLFMKGVRFPNLPLSKASIMIRPQTKGNYTILKERAVMEESIGTPYMIEGYKKIEFNVEEK